MDTHASESNNSTDYRVEVSDFAPTSSHACCCSATNRHNQELDWDAIYHLVMQLNLGERQKSVVLIRFRRVFLSVANNYRDVECYYNKSKLFVITVGIVNPSLLSITTNYQDMVHSILFWVVWTLQLFTSLITAYVNFYKWDKKYFLYLTYKHRIEQEIWTYLELTGRYSIVNPTNDEELRCGFTTHRSKLQKFLLQIETIYRRLRDNDIDIESADTDVDSSGGHHHHRTPDEETKLEPTTVALSSSSSSSRESLFEKKISDLRSMIDSNKHTDSTDSTEIQERRKEELSALQNEIDRYLRIEERNQFHEAESHLLRGRPVDRNETVEAEGESRRGDEPDEGDPGGEDDNADA